MTDTPAINPHEETLDFKSAIVKDCYSYWRGKVIGDRLPRRSDIDPVDIPKLMPHAVILDVRREPELDFRYRLIGTYVAEHLFKDHTGSWFSEIEYQKAPSTIWQNCAPCYRNRQASPARNALCGTEPGIKKRRGRYPAPR
jgi:hypothetical protein